MKSKLFAVALLIGVLWSAGARAVTAPSGLAIGSYQQSHSAYLDWTDDTTVNEWLVYVTPSLTTTASLAYQVYRQDTSLTRTGLRRYQMDNISPDVLPAIISMKALVSGLGFSTMSTGVTLTSGIPVGGGTMVWSNPASDVIKVQLNATTGTAMNAVFLTLTARSAAFFDNPSGGTITVQTGATSTPPVNADGNVVYIPAHTQLNWNMLQGSLGLNEPWLFYGNTNPVTCSARVSK